MGRFFALIGIFACFSSPPAMAHERHDHGHHRAGGVRLDVFVAPPPVIFRAPSFPVYTYTVVEPRVSVFPAPLVPLPSVGYMEPGFWYYCSELQAYYPQVSLCPTDWKKISPPR